MVLVEDVFAHTPHKIAATFLLDLNVDSDLLESAQWSGFIF